MAGNMPSCFISHLFQVPIRYLRDGFKHPHGLLNAYAEHFSSFKITDTISLATACPLAM